MTDQQPEPPRENTVAAEPATVEACADDYAQRATTHNPGQYTATRHTWGRN